MLLQFSVANYASFKDQVTLNMVPAKSRTMKNHIIIDDKGKKTEALSVAAIYGANASGKTNLAKAIEFARNFIVQGTRLDKPIGVKIHLLDPEMENKPSRFEFIFKHEGVMYTYGFVSSSMIVHEEWLFAHFTAKESRLFERITKDGRAKVLPGKKLTDSVKRGLQFIEFIAEGTRPNQLFLTEANDKNISLLEPVIKWFRENLEVVWPHSKYRDLMLRAHKDQPFTDFLSTFLKTVDTGIHKIFPHESEIFDPNRHLKDFPDQIKTEIIKQLSSNPSERIFIQGPSDVATMYKNKEKDGWVINYTELKTEHLRTDNSVIKFNISDESDGTQRMMHLAPMLQEIQKQERVFVIDELDRSLHPHLSRLFLQICIAGVIKQSPHGQFIVTTHDTNLLDRSILRKDEIWFMEKDKNGASHLTSLAEFKIAEGLNYEKGYLNGRFGAIPFIGKTKDLLR